MSYMCVCVVWSQRFLQDSCVEPPASRPFRQLLLKSNGFLTPRATHSYLKKGTLGFPGGWKMMHLLF